MPAIGDFLTNEEIRTEIGYRLRMRRIERNLTIDTVAELAGLNRKTVIDAESGGDIRLNTFVELLRLMNLLTTFEALLPDSLPGGEAFSSRGQIRQRASGRDASER